jgi:CspA family cold shock protein
MAQFGTVKFFNEQKGYGFIEQCTFGENVFMHIGEMADGMMPRKGDILSYDMGKNKKKPGKMMAVNVRGGSATQLAYGAAEYGGDGMDMRSMMPMMHMMMTMMIDKSKWSQFEEKLDALEKGFQELRMLVEDVKETLRAPNKSPSTAEEVMSNASDSCASSVTSSPGARVFLEGDDLEDDARLDEGLQSPKGLPGVHDTGVRESVPEDSNARDVEQAKEAAREVRMENMMDEMFKRKGVQNRMEKMFDTG